MPNWCYNELKFNKREQYEDFKSRYCTYKEDASGRSVPSFDFETICPCPESLSIKDDTSVNDRMFYFLTDKLNRWNLSENSCLIPEVMRMIPDYEIPSFILDKYTLNIEADKPYSKDMSLIALDLGPEKIKYLFDNDGEELQYIVEDKPTEEGNRIYYFMLALRYLYNMVKEMNAKYGTAESRSSLRLEVAKAKNRKPVIDEARPFLSEYPEDWFEMGRTYITNLFNYGAYGWYDWSCRNWGTKWNAKETTFNDNELTVMFDTAWSSPSPILWQMARQNPDWEVKYSVSYEASPEWFEGEFTKGQFIITKGYIGDPDPDDNDEATE